MKRSYYEMELCGDHGWVLDTPYPAPGGEFDEPWMFTDGKRLPDLGAMRVLVSQPGERLNFTLCIGDRIPILSKQAAAVFRELAPNDVQLFPVKIEGQAEQFYVLNAVKQFKCVDEKNSLEVQLYPSDGTSPERAGEYRWVHGMRIDISKIEDARVFRPWGWTLSLIVAEEIKEALEKMGSLGVRFNRVTGPHEPLPPPREVPAPLKQAREARAAAYSRIGELSTDVVSRILPTSGNWPSGAQAWRIIKRGQRTLFMSDGLSDPFSDASGPSVGFGFELAVETDEELRGDDGWPLDMLMWLSDGFANSADTRKLLDTGLAFIQFSGKGMPQQLVVPPEVFKTLRPNDWVSEHGMSMALFGLETPSLPASFPTPAGPVRLLSVMAMFSSEMVAYLERGGDEVLPLFLKCADKPLSSTKRKPVI